MIVLVGNIDFVIVIVKFTFQTRFSSPLYDTKKTLDNRIHLSSSHNNVVSTGLLFDDVLKLNNDHGNHW
jgi:hypothetical protein